MAELLFIVKLFLVTTLDRDKKIRIMIPMFNGTTIIEHPTRLEADGVLFGRGGDRLVAKDAEVTSPKRQFEPGSPHQTSGTDIVGAMAAPDLQPRDCGPWCPTVANIADSGRNFHGSLSPNLTDCGRHEQSSSRQTN